MLDNLKRQALMRSTFCALAVTIALLVSTISVVFLGCEETAFASRWDGGCTGWTKELAAQYMAQDFVVFVSYSFIGTYIYCLHPPMKRVHSSGITRLAVCLVFLTCAEAHLLSAITNYHPCYRFILPFRYFGAIVGCVGAAFVGLALADAYKIAAEHSIKLKDAERALAD